MKHQPTRSVLFVCQLNSVRSPMAEGLMRNLHPNLTRIASCGLTPGDLDDFMVTVMREKGVDMSAHEATGLHEYEGAVFDHVICFTQAAYGAAQAVFEDTNSSVQFWPIPDPGAGSLDVRALLNNYRAIRDNIDTRLRQSFISAQ